MERGFVSLQTQSFQDLLVDEAGAKSSNMINYNQDVM